MEQSGTLERDLRLGILARGAGDPTAVPEPYDTLARQIGEDSFRVTDVQVDAVLRDVGSERDAFEVVLTASIGAGLRRWDVAAKAIREADGATS
ncbi:hypothetical protein GCM10027568_12780 [Humibacter soli]